MCLRCNVTLAAFLCPVIAVEFEMILSYLLPCILYVLSAPKVLNKINKLKILFCFSLHFLNKKHRRHLLTCTE